MIDIWEYEEFLTNQLKKIHSNMNINCMGKNVNKNTLIFKVQPFIINIFGDNFKEKYEFTLNDVIEYKKSIRKEKLEKLKN
jgi:hypothetical protein